MAIQVLLRRIRKSRSIRDPGSSPNTVRNPGGQAENLDGPWQGVFGAPLTWVFPNHLVYLAVPPMTQETSHERAFVLGAGLEAQGSHQPSVWIDVPKVDKSRPRFHLGYPVLPGTLGDRLHRRLKDSRVGGGGEGSRAHIQRFHSLKFGGCPLVPS